MVSRSKDARSLPHVCSRLRYFGYFFGDIFFYTGFGSFSPIQKANKKSGHEKTATTTGLFFFLKYSGFSSVKRVIGSPVNFQSAVNTYAVLSIAMPNFVLGKFKFFFSKKKL